MPEGADNRRLARAHDKLSQMVNSWLGQGMIAMTGQGEYVIRGGAIVDDRAPTGADDLSVGAFQGCAWMDTSASKMYFCTSAALGAATWIGPIG